MRMYVLSHWKWPIRTPGKISLDNYPFFGQFSVVNLTVYLNVKANETHYAVVILATV